MMRVLHVIDHLDLGGAQTALLALARNRDRAGFEVEVAVLHGRGSFAEAFEEAGVKVHSLAPAKWPPSYIPAFLRLVASGRFDVLHFHLQGANWLAKPLAALAGAPVRIAHDHTSGDLAFRGWGSLLPDSFTHLFSTKIIAVSDGVRDFLTRWEAVSPGRVEVIANGVDETAFHPASPEEHSAARRHLRLPAETFVVGAMGRLAPEKNFALLAEMAVRHPDIVFVVAGTGPEAERLGGLVDRLGVRERMRFLGAVSDRPGFYHALDAFLLPSLYEGLPMVLLEAMACGVPVLASRLEGIRTALREDRDGLLADPGNPAEFSGKLGRLAADGRLRGMLAESARETVASRFSAARAARLVEAVYSAQAGLAPGGGNDKRGGS